MEYLGHMWYISCIHNNTLVYGIDIVQLCSIMSIVLLEEKINIQMVFNECSFYGSLDRVGRQCVRKKEFYGSLYILRTIHAIFTASYIRYVVPCSETSMGSNLIDTVVLLVVCQNLIQIIIDPYIEKYILDYVRCLFSIL